MEHGLWTMVHRRIFIVQYLKQMGSDET